MLDLLTYLYITQYLPVIDLTRYLLVHRLLRIYIMKKLVKAVYVCYKTVITTAEMFYFLLLIQGKS